MSDQFNRYGSGRIAVRLERHPLPFVDAFAGFSALRRLLGDDEVFLLESPAGPEADRRTALIGFSPLLTVSVRGGLVAIDGSEPLRSAAAALVDASGATGTGPGSGSGSEDSGSVGPGAGRRLRRPSALWSLLRSLRDGFDVSGADATGFGFGFLTVFGYDTVHYIEDLPRTIPTEDDLPDAVVRIYAGTLEVDLAGGEARLCMARSGLWSGPHADDLLPVLAESSSVGAPPTPADPPSTDLAFTMTAEEYRVKAKQTLEHIALGDVYQVQIGHEVRMHSAADALSVYLRMRAENPSPYMALIPLPGFTVVSASPELHVRVASGRAAMRPIAGTVRRDGDRERDHRNAEWLRSAPKEIAEHVMLVDLCRNDLGRVARPGSVEVPEMMSVEGYSRVLHLVSTITAELDPAVDVFDVVRATFPAGTMTGAPKIRAMEVIEDLEVSRRGLYAGTFGVLGFGGYANLALSIRTLIKQGDTYTARASAGIVADSAPELEWAETLAKLSSPVWAVAGTEL